MRPVTFLRANVAHLPPTVLLAGSILSVQVGAAFAKHLFQAIGPGGAVFMRVGVGAVVLLAWWRPRLARYTWAQYRVALLFGLTLALMNFAFYLALDRVPLGIAVTIEFVGPLGVAVAGSRRLLDGLWVLLAAVGVLLLAPWTGAQIDPLGILFALVAGGCWASYILLSARVGRAFADGSGLALAMGFGAVVLIPVGVISAGTTLWQPSILLVGGAVGLLSSVLPYSLEIEALRHIPPRLFGIFMSVEPAVAALIGFLLLGEIMTPRSILAITLVMLASVGASLVAPAKAGG